MMKILVEMYNKNSGSIEGDFRIKVPEKLIFQVTEQTNINYINSVMFEADKVLKEYLISIDPSVEEKFDQFDVFFIGREGLPEDY